MKGTKCYDGGRHRWRETVRQQMTRFYPDGSHDPVPTPVHGRRCERCDEFRPSGSRGLLHGRSILAAVLLLMALPGIVGAHTGSIEAEQTCEFGTAVTAFLDANVAEGATWTVTVNGTEADSGTGPGPADLGPYDAGFEAGSATLDIVYQQEHNTYVVEYGDVEPCEQPTPTPQPTPCNPRAGGDCATPPPNPTPTPHTPSRTLPPTYTRLVAVEHSDAFIPFWAAVILILAGLVGGWATLRRIR